ncbi:hypothetical protein CVT25_009236 [Psilocybe cyanescens]|uniref:Uncharacterized protein n=1 Tax=Psilocybe cyanescens TaxID=93625 RepID=A0A409XTF2_PSICY|nr:hypothetical protein CVT25_009236 [Psilocybe cyanescens]
MWTREWSRTPKTGEFAPANHIPPSLRFPTPNLKHILNSKNPANFLAEQSNVAQTMAIQADFVADLDSREKLGAHVVEQKSRHVNISSVIALDTPKHTQISCNSLNTSKYLRSLAPNWASRL